jgi:hypothetical protein
MTNTEMLFCQWIDDKIQRLTISRFENEIEALKHRGNSKMDYCAGLAQGAAIADKCMVSDLMELKSKLSQKDC